ncbi:MAG: hypothetical protein JSV79_07410 [Armatimonadota bacterium]|nr:MAG: hypothetical protein JSV79_07410 [Armatimonadota bacterium]
MWKKRLTISAGVVLLAVGTVAVLWHVLDWPPPRLILKYGFPPAGGPTGRTETVGDLELIEVDTRYAWADSQWIEQCEPLWISRAFPDLDSGWFTREQRPHGPLLSYATAPEFALAGVFDPIGDPLPIASGSDPDSVIYLARVRYVWIPPED